MVEPARSLPSTPLSSANSRFPFLVPVKIKINLDKNDESDPEKAALLEQLQDLVERKLVYYPSFNVPFPPSNVFSNDPVSLAHLIQASDRDMSREVESLAIDASTGHGGARRLSHHQFHQVAQTGTFGVESLQHPSHTHVWKVALWLQKGHVEIRATVLRGIGRALYHLVQGVPDRLVRREPWLGVRRGWNKLCSGLIGLASTIFGWIECLPLYSEYELGALLLERENDYVYEQLTRTSTTATTPNKPRNSTTTSEKPPNPKKSHETKQADEVLLADLVTGVAMGDEKLVSERSELAFGSTYQLNYSSRQQRDRERSSDPEEALDDEVAGDQSGRGQSEPTSNTEQGIARLYDNAFLKQIKRTTSKVRSRADYDWQQMHSNQERMKIKAKLDKLDLDGSEYAKYLDRALERCRMRFIARYLVAANESWGQLVADQDHFMLIVAEVEQDLNELVDNAKERFREEVKKAHPIVSLVDEWVNLKVKEKSEAFYTQLKWGYYENIPVIASEEGLVDLASIYKEHIICFQKERKEEIRRSLSSETQPARIFQFKRRIWRPANWIKKDIGRRDEAPVYVAVKYRMDEVQTDSFLWRFAIITQKGRANFCNGLHWLFRSVWNGSVGVKSLFFEHPFVSLYQMDRPTGDIVPDRAHLTGTLRSRLRGIREHVHDIREKFEALPDTGFLGKPIARFLNILSAYVGIAIPGTLFLVLGQPLLTVLNIVVTIFLAVTSPLWAPLSSLLEYIFCISVYDYHQTGRRQPSLTGPWFPLFGYLVSDVLLFGILRTAVAAFLGIVVHPVLAVLRFIWAVTRGGLRTVYDFVLRNLLVRFGRVPGRDSFLAWRIAGPGITSRYCFQIQPAVALRAFEAKLESQELELFEKDAREKIEEPWRKYCEFFQPFAAFGLSISELSPPRSQPFSPTTDDDGHGTKADTIRGMSPARDSQLQVLREKVSERQRQYRQLISFGSVMRRSPTPRDEASRGTVASRWIKQNAQDLEETLRLATDLVTTFCKRVEARYSLSTANCLWYNSDVTIGNYDGLARYFIVQLFGKEFLEPLEVTDETIVVPIHHEQLEELVHTLMKPDSIKGQYMKT